MKLKTNILLWSVLVGLAFSTAARAQELALVAGWDFNSLDPAGLRAVAANYSDDAFGSPQDGLAAASRGTFLANGTFGTESLPLIPPDGVSISGTPDTLSRPIASRSPGLGGMFDHLYNGTTDNAVQIANRNTLNPQTFGFQVDASNVWSLTTLSLWLSKSSPSNLTIDWSYKIGNGAATSLSSMNLSSLPAGTYTNYLVDLSSIPTEQGLVTILGASRSTSLSTFALRIDNTGIYGAIPEPAAYVAILGALTMGLVALRRHRRARAQVDGRRFNGPASAMAF